MSKIPTAAEFIAKKIEMGDAGSTRLMLIEFAKLHVEAALEAAAEKANMIGETQHNNNAPDQYEDFVYVSDPNGPDYGYRVNKDSILNAYPQENIK